MGTILITAASSGIGKATAFSVTFLMMGAAFLGLAQAAEPMIVCESDELKKQGVEEYVITPQDGYSLTLESSLWGTETVPYDDSDDKDGKRYVYYAFEETGMMAIGVWNLETEKFEELWSSVSLFDMDREKPKHLTVLPSDCYDRY